MKPWKTKKTGNNNSYLEVNLERLFGVEIPDNSSFRQAVGQAIIDIIVERTENAEYLNNAKKKYSDDYADSLAFTIFGKSKNNVNLTQSGDMLGTLDIIEENSDSIRIGWDNPDIAARGTNHNFGITVPRRKFLGLNEDEISKIKNEFKDDIKTFTSQSEFGSSVDNLRSFLADSTVFENADARKTFRELFSGIDDVGEDG